MHPFFYGWYMKCQSDSQTLAVIPAVHEAGGGRTCSIQVITEEGAHVLTFPGAAFCRRGRTVSILGSRFSEKGIWLSVETPELTMKGKLRFGPLTPLRYDIMGPFALVPFLECRHSVWSMRHSVRGTVYVNGRKYVFRDAVGYWEGDRGRSFPRTYLWTQCCFPGGSLMLSVAEIPMAGFCFTGIIGVVLWQGKQYRLATYLGARVAQAQNETIRIVQGNLELEARLPEAAGHPLKAPAKGDMVRTIHERAACKAFYRFCKGKRTCFAFETDRASFEYERAGGKPC